MAKKLAVLALALGVCSVWASESNLQPPKLDQYLRWGALRVRPGLALSNVGYDDNILYNDTNKVSDYTATVSPKVELLVLFGDRAFLQLNQRFDFTLYLENTDQNFDNNHTAARVTVPWSKIGFFADLGFDRLHQRPIDLESIRVERKEKTLDLGVIFDPNWRTEIELAQTAANLSYDDPTVAQRQDRDERGTRIDASYRIFGRSRILLAALVKDVDFANVFDTEIGPVRRDTREWRLLGGLGFGEGGSLTGEFRVGRARIDARDPVVPDLSEIVGDAELALRLGSRTKLQLRAARLPGYAFFEASTYYLETRGGLRIVRYLNRIVGLEAGGSLGRLTFPSSLSGTEREDDLTRYDVGVRLRLSENSIGRRVEYRFKIGRSRRESTLPSQNQNRNTVSFDAVVGF